MATRDFNPLEIFFQLEQDFLRSTESAFNAMRFQMRTDMYETEEALIIKVELAGVHPDQLNLVLSADDRVLTISGERAEPERERQERLRCYHLEICYGRFEREIALPAHLRIDRERVSATYREGFLIVSLPRKGEHQPASRVIQVTEE
jgi:HSP20 family protein